MTRANDVKQRVILLATNSSQSIIGESVEGKVNTIGYSAYGEQSAQQEVARRWVSTANCAKPNSAGICWATATAPTTRD